LLAPLKSSVVRAAILPIGVAALVVFCLVEVLGQPAGLLPKPPELRSKDGTLSLTLHAGVTREGKNSFYFNGHPDAPTLRLSPGDQLKITYINDLPATPQERCLATPCMDMTNLHFHGLTISPDAPQDDVLTMMAMPGKTLNYTVQIPKDHPPGLYWYHTHPHGESYRQALDGMSGALVIEDIVADAFDERALFHLLNLAREDEAFVLVTTRTAPVGWSFAIRDLGSRLKALPVVVLTPPDDALLRAVLVKLFADRQLAVDESLIGYLATRIERSFAGARDVVARLDDEAMLRKRPLTRALATEVLRAPPA